MLHYLWNPACNKDIDASYKEVHYMHYSPNNSLLFHNGSALNSLKQETPFKKILINWFKSLHQHNTQISKDDVIVKHLVSLLSFP